MPFDYGMPTLMLARVESARVLGAGSHGRQFERIDSVQPLLPNRTYMSRLLDSVSRPRQVRLRVIAFWDCRW